LWCTLVLSGDLQQSFGSIGEIMSVNSVPFQVLIFFNSWYTVLFCLWELGLELYKGAVLPYPKDAFGGEIAFIVLYFFVDLFRYFCGKDSKPLVGLHPLGSQANKSAQQLLPVILFFALSVPLVIANVYFIVWQIYVYVHNKLSHSIFSSE
jgi:hypothetical protein